MFSLSSSLKFSIGDFFGGICFIAGILSLTSIMIPTQTLKARPAAQHPSRPAFSLTQQSPYITMKKQGNKKRPHVELRR